jgi:hypothetical protein
MKIENLGRKVKWYENEEPPISIIGYLEPGNTHYKFYPIKYKNGTITLSDTPSLASFYDEGAEGLTQAIVQKYGCQPLNPKNISKALPNIRLICYPTKNILEILYGLDLLEKNYLPQEQEKQLESLLTKRNIIAKISKEELTLD